MQAVVVADQTQILQVLVALAVAVMAEFLAAVPRLQALSIEVVAVVAKAVVERVLLAVLVL
jgi:hypothetical protein